MKTNLFLEVLNGKFVFWDVHAIKKKKKKQPVCTCFSKKFVFLILLGDQIFN